MIPEWILQIALAVFGVLGGICIYHLSQRNFHYALWSGTTAVVLLVIVIALYIRNDLIKKELESGKSNNITGSVNNKSKPSAETSVASDYTSPHDKGNIGSFPKGEAERPRIWLKSIALINLEAGKLPTIQFEFENIGDSHAFDVTIETGIYSTTTKLLNDPPPMVFTSNPSKTLLPKGKVMTKTLPFGSVVNSHDIEEIGNDTLFIYAYSVIHYNDGPEVKPIRQHTLKFCALYNPKTTYFQNTPFFNYTD